ncbi:MAG TPA: cyclase family protein [Actinomycetota bacterium]|nr:cyclase family protein [Actinomycetota bacterium]
MFRSQRAKRVVAGLAGSALFAAGAVTASTLGRAAVGDVASPVALPSFTKVVNLSHVNDPARTPLFPGDPSFTIRTVFTVPEDGFYLEVVREGTHTGTHYSAPCHFHQGAACMDELKPGDLVLPAVVIDVRDEVAADPDHIVRTADLQAWEMQHGEMPAGAAVLLLTGCDAWWAKGDEDGEPNYYNCGSGERGDHQPGFSRNAVKWLIETGVLAERGALGSDTFGPDPSSDAAYVPTSLTLRRHRVTIENLTNLDALPPTGAWIVLGGPRNANGSGAPGTVFGLVP